VANSQPIIRPTVPADLDAISEIYAHRVRTGVATFEVDPPDAREWEKRFGAVIDSGLPFISAEMDGAIAGYAYCVQWKSRPAYRHTVEDSIYLAPDAVGGGVGGRLLDALLARCTDVLFGRSSPSSWTTAPTHRLRCTAIAVSSMRAGCPRSAQARPVAGHPAASADPQLSRSVMSVKAGLSLR
jgi:GNAT superfamily N-acetyltransferase